MKKNDTYKIYKTNSPSEKPVVVGTKDIIVATMTCGGGMGGARWKEYLNAVEMDSIPSNGIAIYTDAITGQKKAINTKYVVMVEEKQMLNVYHDITAWKNYHGKVCDKCFAEMYIVLDRGAEWECVDECGSGKDDAIVKKTIYEE